MSEEHSVDEIAETKNYTTVNRRRFVKALGIGGSATMFGLGRAAAAEKRGEEMVWVPAGKKVPKSKVISHENVPKSEVPDFEEKIKSKTSPNENRPKAQAVPTSPPPPSVDGWQAYADTTFTGGFGGLTSTFDVPVDPPNWDSNAVVFWFPGFQDSSSSGPIVQPVLQWNWGDSDGWEIAAWWGPDNNGNYHHGYREYAAQGDRLEGNVFANSTTIPTKWTITLQNHDRGTRSLIETDSLGFELDWGFTALEVYNTNSCSDLSGAAKFENMEFYDRSYSAISVDWGTWIHYDACNEIDVDVESQSLIEIWTGALD